MASHSLEQIPSPHCCPGPLAPFSLGVGRGTEQAPICLSSSLWQPLHPALGRLPACLCFLSLASPPPPPHVPHLTQRPSASPCGWDRGWGVHALQDSILGRLLQDVSLRLGRAMQPDSDSGKTRRPYPEQPGLCSFNLFNQFWPPGWGRKTAGY